MFFQMFVAPWQTALCLLLTADSVFQMFVYPWQIGLLYILLTADSVFPAVCVPMADRLVVPFTYSRQSFSRCLCTLGRQACCTFYLQPTVIFQVFVYPWQTALLYLLLTADSVFPDVRIPMADRLVVPFTYSRRCFSRCLCTHGR